jgi:hypothetical protein
MLCWFFGVELPVSVYQRDILRQPTDCHQRTHLIITVSIRTLPPPQVQWRSPTISAKWIPADQPLRDVEGKWISADQRLRDVEGKWISADQPPRVVKGKWISADQPLRDVEGKWIQPINV